MIRNPFLAHVTSSELLQLFELAMNFLSKKQTDPMLRIEWTNVKLFPQKDGRGNDYLMIYCSNYSSTLRVLKK